MHEPVLYIDRALSGSRLFTHISAIGLHGIGKLVVPQLCIQYIFTKLANMDRVFEGEEQFHAAIKVALHQVGRPQIDLLLSTVEKIKDPAMLQITAYNAGNSDILADTLHSRAQAAHPPDEEINLHACLGGLVQRFDRAHICQ